MTPVPSLAMSRIASCQLRAAIAAQRPEGVTGQTFGVDPHEDVALAPDIAPHHGQVVLAVELGLVDVPREVAEFGGDPRRTGDALHQLVLVAPVPDEIGDGDELQPVRLGELLELGQARHAGLVGRHELAQHPGGVQARRRHEIDGGLGVAGALQHPASLVPKREDVTRTVELARAGVGVDERVDRRGPVFGGDARRGPVAVVDADGEGGALRFGVLAHHERKLERIGALGEQRHADDPGGVGQEKGDLLGRDGFGRHDQVSLVLAVLVVDHHDDLPPPHGLDGILDGAEAGHGAAPGVEVELCEGASSTRRSGPSCVTDTIRPRHRSSTRGAPGPLNMGTASSPPNRAGAK